MSKKRRSRGGEANAAKSAAADKSQTPTEPSAAQPSPISETDHKSKNRSLPQVNGREVIRALQKFGFEVRRVSGSHHIMKKIDHGNNVSVPVHGSRSIKRGTLADIISAAGIGIDEFIAALN